MIERCHNPNHSAYERYGAVGIKVCRRWRVSFGSFLHDMGEPPFDGAQIDRNDNSKGYSKNNCRWVSRQSNMNNRSDNRRITHEGETLTLADWSRRSGISSAAISHRLKRGWTVERALSEPVKKAIARISASAR